MIKQPIWQKLSLHQADLASFNMRKAFDTNPHRFSDYSLDVGTLFLDFSRNRINHTTISLLCELASSSGLSEKIKALFDGGIVNATENRPALHTALRDTDASLVSETISSTLKTLTQFVSSIHDHSWRGATGKPIEHIVNIGIGGSSLGPLLGVEALKDFAVSPLKFHFISTVDLAKLRDLFTEIDPETTLCIISSKSFTTLETLTNAHTLRAWLAEKLGTKALDRHFVAITSAHDKALHFGIPASQIFPIWDWVGGRYSIWSAIGLPIMLMIGMKQFNDFLSGAREIDRHFQTAPFHQNMPVLLALLSLWYMNFFHAKAQAIVPYAHRLRSLVPYLQQVDMESNGKSTRLNGEPVTYHTGPVIFGQEGCDGQHAYHQMLHQSQQLIPVDFILVKAPAADENRHHHDLMLASALAQAQALMRGKTQDEAHEELIASGFEKEEAARLAPHRAIPGNKPSNVIILSKLDPKHFGALLSLYEHKIFTQGVLWDINSFDQFGVELGKELLQSILQHMQNVADPDVIDPETLSLIHLLKTTDRA